MRQLVEFLINYKEGVNVVAIVLNGQVDRYTRDTEKFIKITHQMLNHPDFWEHICIIFSKWYSGMTAEQKQIKQTEYKKRVIESINRYTERNINLDLPIFFLDSPNYTTDENTRKELERFNNFVISKNAMKTTQAEVPNIFYEKVIPEKRDNYRYKENVISEDKMKRTEYFANQSRNKLVDFDGNISYSDWKNDKEWEIIKNKKIEVENKTECTKTDTIPIYETRNHVERFLGVCIVNDYYRVHVGNRTVKTYEDKKRNKITDFDGNVSYEDWVVIKTYQK